MTRRVVLLGFGNTSKFMIPPLLEDKIKDHELVGVWNHHPEKMDGLIDTKLIIENVAGPGGEELDLHEIQAREPDLIFEVSHPSVTINYGEELLKIADYAVGSPTAFVHQKTYRRLITDRGTDSGNALYVPRGALGYGTDFINEIKNKPNGVGSLTVTMEKTPPSLKYDGQWPIPPEEIEERGERTLIFEGRLDILAADAPKNVNTMVTAALAAGLPFDQVTGILYANPNLEGHLIHGEVIGAGDNPARRMWERYEPATSGKVTSPATMKGFLKSLGECQGEQGGIHIR